MRKIQSTLNDESLVRLKFDESKLLYVIQGVKSIFKPGARRPRMPGF